MRRPNYPGIFAGAIVFWVFGAIWFTIFKGPWLAAVTLGQQNTSPPGPAAYVLAFLAALLIAYCFDNMLWHYETADASKGAQVGVLGGLGIGCAVIVTMYGFEMRPLSLILIDCGYVLVGSILNGAVVGALRARAKR